MNNVFTFLWRHNFFLTFLLLEVLAIGLIIKYNNFYNDEYIYSANQTAGKLHTISDNISKYFNLYTINEQLAAENARLHSQALHAYIIADTSFNTKKIFTHEYNMTSARVIKNSVHHSNNYLLINKGFKHGITHKMGVINSEGVVGVIMDVSDNYAAVLSVLNKKTKVSGRIKQNQQIGSVSWQSMNFREATLEDIPIYAKINIGDTVVTSGNSSIFPAGVPIGTIKKFSKNDGESFYSITLHLAVDYNALNQVYIVNHLLRDEVNALEKRIEPIVHD